MVSTADLHKALNAYMEGDDNRYTRGDWSVAKGGYDLIFEVYYKDTPVADYVRDRHDSTDKGELSVWGNFTQEEKDKIANCICKTCDIDISAIKRDGLEEDLENDDLDDR